MMRILFFIIFSSIVISNKTFSQTTVVDSAKVDREGQEIRIQPILRLDHVRNSGSYFYFETSAYFPDEYIALFNEQSRWYFWAGAVHKATDHWFLGTSLKLNLAKSYATIIPRFDVLHKGKIGKFDFWKEITYEHIIFEKKNWTRKAEGRVAISTGLGHSIYKHFYFSLLIKPYLSFDFQNDDFSYYKNRYIDRFKTRLDFFYNHSDNFRLGVFFMRDTEMWYRLGRFDTNNNPIEPDAKVNLVTPLLGLSVHFILNSSKDETFLTGWPSR